MKRLTMRLKIWTSGALGVVGMVLAAATPVCAQGMVFANPALTAWASGVQTRLATRDSLEAVYTRTNARLAQDQNALAQLAYQRPAYGESSAAFAQRMAYQQQQIRQDMIQTQSALMRTQQRLTPLYGQLNQDYRYAMTYQDPAVRQSVGSLIASAGHGLDPIWIHTPPIVVPAAGAAGASGVAATDPLVTPAVTDPAVTPAATAGAGGTATDPNAGAAGLSIPTGADAQRDQQISNSMMLNGSARNVPPADSAASQTQPGAATQPAAQTGAAATAGEASAPNAIWTLEKDAASSGMVFRARDVSTKALIDGAAPLPTSEVAGNAANLGKLRSVAWVAEHGADGNTVFKPIDFKTRQPITNIDPVNATGTTELASAPAAAAHTDPAVTTPGATTPEATTAAAGGTAATIPAGPTAADMTKAVWTAEPNPSTGLMVLRAHDPVSNNHLAGYKPVETDMPIPPGGHSDGVSATRSTFKNVTYAASHDAESNTLTFTPTAKNGSELPPEVKTVTSHGPEAPSGAAASDVNTANAEANAAGEATGAKSWTAKLPSAGQVASSAAKWGGLSIGVTLASNVADQFIRNKGQVNWNQATSFLTDSHFWGGTAGGFVGSMAGGALAAFVPGGAFVKAALSIGGAALGYQVGSGQLKNTDWVGLGVTTLGAAAGTALGATMGPVGALVGGIAGQMVSQLIYDKIKEMRQTSPTAMSPPYAGKVPTPGGVPYLPPALPPGQFPTQLPVTQVPSQMPVSQMPVSQVPVSQVPVGQYPSQIPVGPANLGSYGPSGIPVPPSQLLAGPPGAQSYGSAQDITNQLNRVYQAKLLADQAGNAQLSNQYLLQYQALRRQLDSARQGAYQSGNYGDYRTGN